MNPEPAPAPNLIDIATHCGVFFDNYEPNCGLVGAGTKTVKIVKTQIPFPPLAEGEVRVRAERMPALLAAVQKLAKRAARLGILEPQIETVRTERLDVVAIYTRNGFPQWTLTGDIEEYGIVVAPATPVRLDGWRFAAVIEHLPATEGVEAMNLVRTSPAFTIPLPHSYRSDAPTCDHCRTTRRRAETFVLHKDATESNLLGRWARVGRSCLSDYVGDANASQLVHAAAIETALSDLLSDAGWDESDGGGARHAVEPTAYLTAVALAIESVGWVSRTVARQTEQRSTSEWAWIRFDRPRKLSGEDRAFLDRPITEAHRADAEAALQWARAIAPDTESDFLYNCRVVAQLPAWEAGKVGIAAAILMAYQKEQERLKRIQHERRLPSRPYGVVGERFGGAPVKGKKGAPVVQPLPALRARVLGVHARDGSFGLQTIVRFQALGQDGTFVHDGVWFATGEVRVTVDEAAAAAWTAAQNRHARAQDGWLHADGIARRSRYDRDVDPHDRATIAQNASSALLELQAAEAELVATRESASTATRGICPGDLIDITGTVKRCDVSMRTERIETIVTRCSLRWVPESACLG